MNKTIWTEDWPLNQKLERSTLTVNQKFQDGIRIDIPFENWQLLKQQIQPDASVSDFSKNLNFQTTEPMF